VEEVLAVRNYVGGEIGESGDIEVTGEVENDYTCRIQSRGVGFGSGEYDVVDPKR